MPQTQDMTPHPVTVNRHRDDLSLCYPMMWNTTLQYTATHFNVGEGGGGLIGKSFPDIPQTTANAQLDAVMVVNSRKLSRKYHTNRVLNRGPVVCESIALSARPQRLTDFNAILCWLDGRVGIRIESATFDHVTRMAQ